MSTPIRLHPQNPKCFEYRGQPRALITATEHYGAVMNRPVDLTNCDREPIHIPGSIQPFGFLLGLQSDFTVCMASENAADYLGRDYTDVFQRPVQQFAVALRDQPGLQVDAHGDIARIRLHAGVFRQHLEQLVERHRNRLGQPRRVLQA